MKDRQTAVNTVETDFRAEIVAAGLIESGQPADKTHIIRRKGNMRGVSKDIDKISKDYFDSGFDFVEYLCIYTNRSSIYESLPEGVFHQPVHTKRQKNKEEILQEIKDHREEEFFARKYFQPFEMALDKVLVDAQLYEQKYHKAHIYDNLSAIFREQWEILQHLSIRQALFFMKVLPVIEEVSRSFALTARVMGVVLDCPVSIREGKKSWKTLDREETVTLGKWRLGINSVPGKAIRNDNVDLEITVGPVSTEQMRLFESGANNDRILKCLIDLTIPFDRNTIVKYKVTESEKKFRLSGGTHKAYLGINTTI